MGIPGLTTYIANHSDYFLEKYALHDSYLVIDGNNIVCQLFNWYARCNSLFGGDYDKYAQCVSNFFDELLKCNVTPLVVFDGGCEDKKLKTVISRTYEKTRIASHYTIFQHVDKFLPLHIKEVFKDVMNAKDIKYAQCIFEADNDIAVIARILNCPVLSYDSDFYIYGSLYIPFSTWENNVVRRRNGYVKYCKIYYVDKLFRYYKGLNLTVLPLAAILMGNDYVKQCTFKHFFRHLKLSKVKGRNGNEQQRRIKAILNWLQNHSLNQAIIGILSRIQKEERKHILNIIETIINSYVNISVSTLAILNVLIGNVSKAYPIQNLSKTYKFEGDIYNLIFIEEKSNESEISDDEKSVKEIADILQEKDLISNETLVNNLPEWFINEFKLGRHPSYFIDLIVRKLYVCPTQIEDYSCASSIAASLKIISVIYGLLISEVKGNNMDMKYIARSENNKIKRHLLKYNNKIHGWNLPILSNLRKLPIIRRREILNLTLGISGLYENYLKEIPSPWILYLATMKYWIDQQQEPFKFNYHIYSLLFALLFHIIDYKVGFYRISHSFELRFNKTIQDILYTRRIENYKPQYSMNITLSNAIYEVNTDDCLIAAAFFVSHFEVDPKLYVQPKKFNIATVHAFAEFQSCLRHSMNLNALLEYPYEQTKVADFYNGTLLYNLCTNFQRRNNIEAYINAILQNSPSLSRLFNLLLIKIKLLFDIVLECKTIKHKKRKIRNEKEESITQQEDYQQENTQASTSEEPSFHDMNNPFSILGSMQN